MLSILKKFLVRSGKPADGESLRKLGNRYFDEGRLEEAEAAYRSAIAADSRDAHAYTNLGMVLKEAGRNGEAVPALLAALELDAGLSMPHYLLGKVAQEQLDWAEAARRFLLAHEHGFELQLQCRDLCHALMQSGQAAQARSILEQGIMAAPDIADYHFCLGMLASHAMQYALAIVSYRHALAHDPQAAEKHFHLARAYQESGQLEAALESFRSAIAFDPVLAEAYNCMGVIFNERDQFADAIACFRKTLELQPLHAMALKNLGVVYTTQADLHEAIDCYERFIALGSDATGTTDAGVARWGIAVNRMCILAQSEADPAEIEKGCLQELDELDQWCSSHEFNEAAVVGSMPLFFLAYREMNWRPVLSRHGTLCSRLMQQWHGKSTIAQSRPSLPREQGKKIRLGIVCAEISSHSVWIAFLKGWYERFDRSLFEIQTYFIGREADQETRYAESLSDVFIDLSGKDVSQVVVSISSHAPDILLYPAIGIDRITSKLASLRLAPVQVTAWGHPETSGFPTMDYYLSAEDFEPDHAAESYSERLVRLPHLGCTYTPLNVESEPVDFKAIGINLDIPVLLCPGTSFKYTSEHDAVFIEIARRLGRCQFVFFTSQRNGQSDKLMRRLEQAFSVAGMTISDYCLFIPWQPRAVFYALMRQAHVFLDTIGFSGFNTAIQAAECGIPIVTYDGKFMRGRLASGILRRAGLPELITASEAGFIDLVVRLASDAGYRNAMRHKMSANAAALFHDTEPARALNAFLLSLAAGR